MRVFSLASSQGNLFTVTRHPDAAFDAVDLHEETFKRHGRPDAFAPILTALRRELGALEAEASMTDGDIAKWEDFKKAKAATIKSLQTLSADLMTKTAERNDEAEQRRSQRFEEKEEALSRAIQLERETAEAHIASEREKLEVLSAELEKKKAQFETQDSHYVARKKRDEQITEVKAGIAKWALTEGTSAKRKPISMLYQLAIMTMLALVIFALAHNFIVLKSADDMAKLTWWQWVAVIAKTFFPLAGFTTFLVYYIRWSSAWAERHVEEEFRNRSLLIDLGRASWLLEAVRDAQERKSEIPPDLLKELSRNLFSYAGPAEQDLHPNAFAETALQGLASIRVKSPDGSEVEAVRGKTVSK